MAAGDAETTVLFDIPKCIIKGRNLLLPPHNVTISTYLTGPYTMGWMLGNAKQRQTSMLANDLGRLTRQEFILSIK